MRIVNWNIEWMNDWFVGGNAVAFRPSVPNRGISDTDALCRRVAGVITQLNPDLLTVQEGPSDRREMELFVSTYLVDAAGNPAFSVLGGFDGGAQKIFALARAGGAFRNPRLAEDSLTKDLIEPWLSDIDGDYHLEDYSFTRGPLIVEGDVAGWQSPLRVVVLHTKSKFVHNGRQLWENPATRTEFVIAAMKNRRRISSEAMRVRRYLDELMDEDPARRIAVTGDFNDGPGVDYFEQHYLTHNVTDVLIGSTYYPDLMFHHTFLHRVAAAERFTAVFDDFIDGIANRPLLLDHILASPALSRQVSASGIAHAAYDNAADPAAGGRQKQVSDHRPVFVDLD